MIARTCRRCNSTNLRKNGHTRSGQQKFHCKDCNAYGTLDTKHHERHERRSLAVQLSTRHRAVGKDSGETAHIERLHNTFRQRCANLVRKTLSFAKSEVWLERRLWHFIDHYNLQLSCCLACIASR